MLMLASRLRRIWYPLAEQVSRKSACLGLLTYVLLFAAACSDKAAARAPQVPADPTEEFVRIRAISIANGHYVVEFRTNVFGAEDLEFTDPPPDTETHVHFFFDTVSVEQAGLPGSGPWYGYVGTSPLLHFVTSDRPANAHMLCALVANDDHSVGPNTGNCVRLPDVRD